jgi:hypothetical protein
VTPFCLAEISFRKNVLNLSSGYSSIVKAKTVRSCHSSVNLCARQHGVTSQRTIILINYFTKHRGTTDIGNVCFLGGGNRICKYNVAQYKVSRTAVEVSCLFLSAKARIQFQGSSCGICGGQSGTRAGSSQSNLVFPTVIILAMSHSLICHPGPVQWTISARNTNSLSFHPQNEKESRKMTAPLSLAKFRRALSHSLFRLLGYLTWRRGNISLKAYGPELGQARSAHNTDRSEQFPETKQKSA